MESSESGSAQERYTGLHTYDLLTHSCNHFSNEAEENPVTLWSSVLNGSCGRGGSPVEYGTSWQVCNFLLGQGIPEKIFELQTLDRWQAS